MAGTVNKVILIGHLGKDPEVRYSSGGNSLAIANFSVATNEIRKNKDGNRHDHTEWHRIVAFGKLAETCRELLKKGKLVYLEGRIQTRDWEDQSGVKKVSTEIVASNITLLSKREDGGGISSAEVPFDVPTDNDIESDDKDIPF